jgi:hypothetical protein
MSTAAPVIVILIIIAVGVFSARRMRQRRSQK